MHASDLAQDLGQQLRAERERQGLRQEEVALAAGVSVRTVHQLENGKPTSRLDVLLRVSRALGLELAFTAANRATRRLPADDD